MKLDDQVKRFIWARKQKKLSQGDIASALGIRQQSIGMFERNEVAKPKYLPEACKTIGVRYEWVKDGSEPIWSNDDLNEAPDKIKELMIRLMNLDERRLQDTIKMIDLWERNLSGTPPES